MFDFGVDKLRVALPAMSNPALSSVVSEAEINFTDCNCSVLYPFDLRKESMKLWNSGAAVLLPSNKGPEQVRGRLISCSSCFVSPAHDTRSSAGRHEVKMKFFIGKLNRANINMVCCSLHAIFCLNVKCLLVLSLEPESCSSKYFWPRSTTCVLRKQN